MAGAGERAERAHGRDQREQPGSGTASHRQHRHPGTPYQEAFAELADTYRGKPVPEILPLLRRAADEALLGFTDADLREQADAIRSGARYVLRVRVT
ncbi:hypothetical protein [Streptomyces anulatus]|uniref:Uncharacterized protein n=1 Tax=Streptomyces anulatus TaxID=1892 RepID=A0ABZ1ZWY9_STRAQ|nr:hypothetical protein [Streptomyces anulatus]